MGVKTWLRSCLIHIYILLARKTAGWKCRSWDDDVIFELTGAENNQNVVWTKNFNKAICPVLSKYPDWTRAKFWTNATLWPGATLQPGAPFWTKAMYQLNVTLHPNGILQLDTCIWTDTWSCLIMSPANCTDVECGLKAGWPRNDSWVIMSNMTQTPENTMMRNLRLHYERKRCDSCCPRMRL